MDSSKQVIRQEHLQKRQQIDPQSAIEWSAAIYQNLMVLPEFQQAQSILTYIGSKDNEVDTLQIINTCLQQQTPVWVPVIEGKGLMRWSVLKHLDDLTTSTFGILEPRKECRRLATTFPQPTVCLVPGIVFTRHGNRIGYGGGFFDRFLAEFAGTRIGLAFEVQLRNTVPVDSYDQPVDFVVTERQVYWR